jgi:hypothetical protein
MSVGREEKTMQKVILAILASFALMGAPLMGHAQAIVAENPHPEQAVSAESMAVVAVADVNDAADFSYAQAKVDKYRELMELNGTARNVRSLLGNIKAATRLVILERMGKQAFSPEQASTYDQMAGTVLAQTEARILNDLAVAQSKTFTLDEIQALITANSSISAAKYNSGKFSAPEVGQQLIQSYMVDAVVKIVKTFKESVQS